MLIHDGRNVMVLTDNLSETKQLIRDVMNKSAQNQVKETHVIHLLFLNLFNACSYIGLLVSSLK